MLFNSLEFLIFFALLLAVVAFYRNNRSQKILYLVASYIFYMWWNPVFILLIVFSTVLDYILGGYIFHENNPSKKRFWLICSLIGNLGLLFIFKYFNLFEGSMFYLMNIFGYEATWVSNNIILPVGISFYTFQTMSYSIDLYRSKIKPSKSPLDFAVFVSFFPQLVAGPIVRAAEFLPQLEKDRSLNLKVSNLLLILKGLFKKVVIADNLGFFADAIFSNPDAYPNAIIWMATLAFTVQIYCDFSGYTDIAIGVASMLGFKFPNNFNKPYFALSPSDFWRRWHITLSSWLRDYLYISLGGNQRGKLFTYRNLMLTMLLGGLWHGAHWNFVIWGGLHGIMLIIYRVFNLDNVIAGLKKPGKLFAWLIFQLFVMITWISFRNVEFDNLVTSMHKFLIPDFNLNIANIGIGRLNFFTTLLLLASFMCFHFYSYRVGEIDKHFATFKLYKLLALLFIIAIISYFFIPSGASPFIYFQF